MQQTWRFILGILFIGFCGWSSTTPLYAHHTGLGAEESGIESEEAFAYSLPQNFVATTVVRNLNLPTDMAILPSGDFLVTEKGLGADEFSHAHVRLVRGGLLQVEPVLTISVNALEDSGLLGIVLDPNFASNHYFYLWYSNGADSLGWDGTTYNRLSRFQFDPVSGTADPSGETIILDKVTWSRIHNGGGLLFDDKGNLLITTGDAGSPVVPSDKDLAQDLNSLSGKVLRIRPRLEGGYDIPGDNPYVGDLPGIRPEIYALGLRNPFRITQRQADQQYYLIDVGQETWEEVNLLQSTANYGWPIREGKCAVYERSEHCTPQNGSYTDPIAVYEHGLGQGGGITAISFYEGAKWPAEYQGDLFFADFNSAWVGRFDLNFPDQSYQTFATGLPVLVDMEATDDGIYAVSIVEQSIIFIYYDAEGNRPPTATLKTSTIGGAAPLSVQFSATAQDADNDDLRFHWNFGDGSTLITQISTTSHLYSQDGNYLATLQVLDEDEAKSELLGQTIHVYSGEIATIQQENQIDPRRTLYHGGDQITFSAKRSIGKQGLDPVAPYSWTILLHHNQHEHVLLAGLVSDEVELDIPVETHALGVPVWYEVLLEMRTESGQELEVTHALRPEITTIQLQSWPGPAIIKINQQQITASETTPLIVGQSYILAAAESILYNGKVGRFKNWVVTDSWDGANLAGAEEIISDRQYTLVAGATPVTYIAFYDYAGSARGSYLPSVENAIPFAGN